MRRPTDRANGVVVAEKGKLSVLVKWPNGQTEQHKKSELIKVA